jgi:dTDP-4-amino-4,6-dideoxygalactose transaminase
MDISYQFVAFVVLLLLGVVILDSAVSSQGDSLNSLNNYTLNFTQNPQAGSTLVVDHQVFEFTNNTSLNDGNIPVFIDADVNTTAANLKQAIGNHTSLVVS